ncbi:MAG TPA: type II toxin-antitoxin system RelE/ParE family toxin [Beijerinckiaceae bacterium]
MTAAFILSPAAEDDVVEIADYIAEHDRRAAHRLVNEIYDRFALLAQRPGLGHRRPDLTSLHVRFSTIRGRFMIVYRGETAPIEIVRVLSTYRDIASLLEG